MDLTAKLMSLGKKLGYHYSFKNQPISYAEVFAETGLLPGLARRADQLASLCLGYGIGATFDDCEEGLLGSRVTFDDFTPDSLRLLCIADVLYELVKTSADPSSASLDELLYD